MTKLPIKFRQPIFNSDGTFKDWHFWGINIGSPDESYATAWATASDRRIANPAKSQQSIGICDKQGKEIYMGDILETPDGSRGVLVWFDACLGIASGQIGNYHAIDQVRAGELRLYTIVGNATETPELISC